MVVAPLTEPPDVVASRPRRTAGTWIGHVARQQATPVFVATLLLFAAAWIVAPATFTSASLVAIVIPSGILAIAAIGQTLVVQQKGIDLSVGGMITLAAMSLGVVYGASGSLLLALGAVALCAVGGGVLNGLIVTRLHITPILATLATNSLFLGVVWTISGGSAQLSPESLVTFTNATLFELPMIGWVAVVLVVSNALFMAKSTFGRRFTGAGASPDAARASGVRVHRYVVSAYVASCVFAAFAGILLAGYAGQETYALGAPYQLPVIAAVVVGGAPLTGGRGSVIATGLACILLTLVVQMVLTLGAPTSVQLLVQSIVVGIAATIRLVPWRYLMTKFTRRVAP